MRASSAGSGAVLDCGGGARRAAADAVAAATVRTAARAALTRITTRI